MRLENFTLATVREAPRHNGGPIESPLKPIGVMALYDVGGVLRVPQLGPQGETQGPRTFVLLDVVVCPVWRGGEGGMGRMGCQPCQTMGRFQ